MLWQTVMWLAVWSAGAPATEGTSASVEVTLSAAGQVGVDFHQWMDTLRRAGAARVQIRSPQPGDQPHLETRGSTERPVYDVTAILSPAGELVLPGGRFRRDDVGGLKRYFSDLANRGPVGPAGASAPFGLAPPQWEAVVKDLATKVSRTTKGAARRDAVEDLARQLQFALTLGPQEREQLGKDAVVEELQGMTCGTALACLLRPAGLGFAPRVENRQVRYGLVRGGGAEPVWAIGRPPKREVRELAPALYEFLTVNIENVAVQRVMDAIAARLKMPLLVDHNALARHGIDPEKSIVSLPPGKSTHSLVLRKSLYQAGLKFEVRVDEADQAFLWVTTIKAF